MNLKLPITFGMNIGDPYTNNTYIDIDNVDANLNMTSLVILPALKRDYWASTISAIRFGPPSNNLTFLEDTQYEAIIDSAYPFIELTRSGGRRIIGLILKNLK
jgi:hypothetical protein